VKSISSEGEVDLPKSESYCPYTRECAYFLNNIAPPKKFKKEEEEEEKSAPSTALVPIDDLTSKLKASNRLAERGELPAQRERLFSKPQFDSTATFETFWDTYSRYNDARQAYAREWWRKYVKSDEYAADIMAGLNRFTVSAQWQQLEFVPVAANWLADHRYVEKPARPSKSRHEQKIDEVWRLWEEQQREEEA